MHPAPHGGLWHLKISSTNKLNFIHMSLYFEQRNISSLLSTIVNKNWLFKEGYGWLRTWSWLGYFLLIWGFCPVNRTCVNPNQSCNCDISENKWHSDEGFFITPSSLGITQMVFLQQDDLYDDAQARITLGPLECVETSEFTNFTVL